MEFLYLLVPLAIIILIIVFFSLFPIGLWIEAVASGVHVSIFSMFGMRLRRINPSKIVRPLIKAQKAGIAEFDGVKLNVVSDGDFVAQGKTIVVLRVEGNRIVVREAGK